MSLTRAARGTVGCDEAGRGALAGPVVAAAVVLPDEYCLPGLYDSKQVSLSLRNQLSKSIRLQAVWSVGLATPTEIDTINILQASLLSMHRALSGICTMFQSILVDGKHFNPYKGFPHRCVIRGDSRYDVIAAASIIAKTYRDALMRRLDFRYPNYAWAQNKGYPTVAHRSALHLYGSTPYHRKTFRNVVET